MCTEYNFVFQTTVRVSQTKQKLMGTCTHCTEIIMFMFGTLQRFQV